MGRSATRPGQLVRISGLSAGGGGALRRGERGRRDQRTHRAQQLHANAAHDQTRISGGANLTCFAQAG